MTKQKPKKKIDWITLTLVVVATLMLFFGFVFSISSFYKKFDESNKLRQQLNCVSYFTNEVIQDTNYLYICSTQECEDYFSQKIKLEVKLAGEC